ncbi:MAG: Glu/Leu/Phe/Val dehydrogenase [Chloroflexi bacterium]|nr:Glu/Leu/Phe/Val dehydrogenase [Chloroflexota bacterium]
MKIIEYMERHDYEQLVFCSDPQAGLRAIISIHDTTLGPALGGVRMWPYRTEEEAILDVLRLGQAMTYKSAVAGLNLGGGKTVVIGDPNKDKSDALFRSLGRFVESLNGRYIICEDVGTTVPDMQNIRAETAHVTGLPLSWGGSGDSSAMTAFGVYQGMKACLKEAFGSESVHGRTVVIQGVGKVGSHLASLLRDDGANLIVTDVSLQALERARQEFGATAVDAGAIYDVQCDVFSPNALGAVLNRQTIPRLKCRVIAGGANNQLEEDPDAELLQARGILYAPDYIINAGGVVNLAMELTRYDAEQARAQTAEIYHTMERIITRAKVEGLTTAKVADMLALERINAARRVRKIYLKR